MVCFLALVLESALLRSLKQMNSQLEYMYLIRDLKQLKVVELTLEGTHYLYRTKLSSNTYKTFRALGIRSPVRWWLLPRNILLVKVIFVVRHLLVFIKP
jgi:hypothetical protein